MNREEWVKRYALRFAEILADGDTKFAEESAEVAACAEEDDAKYEKREPKFVDPENAAREELLNWREV